MLTIALSTLRLRWVSFAGTFVALAGGVGLIAAMGLVLAAAVTAPPRPSERFPPALTVVAPPDTLTVDTTSGPRSRPLAASPGLPADVVARVTAATATVPDRTFYAQLAGVPASRPAGHGWSSARYTGYRLTAGTAPGGDGDVVVSGGARVGDRVSVRTAAGLRPYRVRGVVAARPFETAVFFTDAEAARLSPRVDALIVTGPVDPVRPAAGPRALVLTGSGLGRLDPGRRADADALNDTITLVSIAGGFAAFVAIFVVAATFGYSVAQRRREFALLRTAGATPAQLRRMLYGEAALVGVTAGALGCGLGPPAAPVVLDRLVRLGLAPAWLPARDSWVALLVAFGTGLTVALAGVVVASWRASRTPPVEALREATLDTRAMTPGRWAAGLAALAAALVMLGSAVLDPASATSDKTVMPAVMVLVVAAALLGPTVVRPLARALTRPLGRMPGATALVVRGSALTAVRRTSAAAAPVLVTVALTALLGGAAGTIDGAEGGRRDRTVFADYVIRPAGTPGIDRQTVERLAAVDGIDVAAPVPTTVYRVHAGAVLVGWPARVVEPAVVPEMLDVRLRAGTMAAPGDTIVIPENWGAGVGETIEVWFADGTPATLRVAGVVAEGEFPDAYLAAAPGTGPAPLVYVRRHAGADPGRVEAALRAAVAGADAQVLTKRAWATGAADDSADASRIGVLVVLGLILAYTAVAIVNTMLMAAAERGPDVAVLRLAGARAGQILRALIAESLLAVAIGTVLAAAASALGLGALWLALRRLAGPTPIVLPWPLLGAVLAATAVLAVLATVAPLIRPVCRPGDVGRAATRW